MELHRPGTCSLVHLACAGALLLSDTATGLAPGDSPLFYLPLDGNRVPIASVAASTGTVVPAEGDFRPGRRGQCAHVSEDYRFPSAGCFDIRQGTIAFWLRPSWQGTDTTSRYLFCLYGNQQLPEPWLHNRWSMVTGSGRLRFWINGSQAGQAARLEADIKTWESGQWHHVAASWTNLSSGRDDAQVCLYIDGRLVARQDGIRLDVGPVSDTFDIGRDSDGSPNYADADFDEVYIDGRALTETEIRHAVELVDQPAESLRLPVESGHWHSRWWNDAWPYRCRIHVRSKRRVEQGTVVQLPLDVQPDLNALGIAAQVDLASVRVVECDPVSGNCAKGAKPLAVVVRPEALSWSLPRSLDTGQSYAAQMYFGVIDYDTSVPLYLRRRARTWPGEASVPPPSLHDYASDTYGDAWDFDEDDFEEIDQFGNNRTCLQNQQVKDGVLTFDAWQDAYVIWGDMWGSGSRSKRPVAIDIANYPVLKMKVRQSCPSAEWEIFGRPQGANHLLKHKFRVTGQQWQIVRVDLVKDAHWGGVLSAFRIDATSHIDNVHVEIDWVRLTNEVQATRAPLEIYPNSTPALASLDLAAEQTQVSVGTAQTLTVLALDKDKAPVAGRPVTLRLKSNADGHLERSKESPTLEIDRQTRRGRTDESGRLRIVLVSSQKAGSRADVLTAGGDFTKGISACLAVDTQAGPPDHYQVWPTRATTVRLGDLPLETSAQLVDKYGNPLSVSGRRVRLSTDPGARLEPSELVTDREGRGVAQMSIDPDKRWVISIKAADNLGCAGTSAPLSVALDQPRSDPIRLLPNGYFARADGRAFVPLGGFYANWVQKETDDGEWSDLRSFVDTSDEDKRHWMKFLHDNGVSAMRLMLRAHRPDGMEPMDIGGKVNQSLFAQVARYLDLAREFDLQFQMVLHEDYTKPVYFNESHFQQYALPAFAGQDLNSLPPAQRRFLLDRDLLAPIGRKYTDPDAIACQDMYVRELLPLLRNNPQLFAYELENEMVDCPAAWANHALATIRDVDSITPVCVSHGGGGLATADPLWWCRNVKLDFYNFHLYPHAQTTTSELDYGAAVSVLSRYGRMCGPCFLGESAGDQFRRHESAVTRRWVMRDIIWMALTAGSPGVFFWNARGAEVREFKMASQALAQLDLTTWKRARPQIGIDVAHPLDDDKWFRTDQGRKAYAMMGRYVQHYLSQAVDFDFTTDPASYEQSCSLEQFAPPAAEQHIFSLSPGWQISYLARDDWRQLLVYVRNFAGSGEWLCEMRRNRRWQQFLRQREPRPLQIRCRLPGGHYRASLYDLDDQTVTTRDLPANGTVDLGTTDHDFALVMTWQ